MTKSKTTNKTADKHPRGKTLHAGRISSKKVIGASVLVGLVGVTGFGIGQAIQYNNVTDPTSFVPIYSVDTAELNSAKNLLGRLIIADSAQEIPDYASKTMPTWMDVDNDGCVTRYDVLERDLLKGEADTEACEIKSGTFFDYYNGIVMEYNTAISGGGIDIDHIVAKENAWNSGGYNWNETEWHTYINDEDLLVATSASANRQKGGKNAAEWLPQNTEFHCRYSIMQIQIKYKYQLSVSVDEKAVLRNILNTECVVND